MGARGRLRTGEGGHSAWCPGCEEYHFIPKSWIFNGDYGKPSFMPSIVVQGFNEKLQERSICHSFITDGKWHFLADCTHDLRNQTVDLRDEETLDANP